MLSNLYSTDTSEQAEYVERLKAANHITDDRYFIIHLDSFGIPNIRNLILDDPKEVSKRGLDIYLTEILIKYKGEQITIDRNNLTSANTLSFNKFRFDYKDNTKIGCVQLDDIDMLVTNNNLTNVTVHIIEKDYKDVFKKYKNFKIVYYDSFLTEYLKYENDHADRFRNYNIHCGQNIQSKLTHKFLCTNYRYALHRHLMSAFLVNKNSSISWAYSGSLDNLQKAIIFDLSSSQHYDTIAEGITTLNETVPLSLDIEYDYTSTNSSNQDQILLYPTVDSRKSTPTRTNKDIYKNTFCSIICESEFFEITSNVSEKTFNAMYNRKPFVILGSPNTLQLIKDLGFKTFDNYWSEEYDALYDSKERFEKVCETINFIDSHSLNSCQQLLVNMKPILEHNYNRLKLFNTGVYIK